MPVGLQQLVRAAARNVPTRELPGEARNTPTSPRMLLDLAEDGRRLQTPASPNRAREELDTGGNGNQDDGDDGDEAAFEMEDDDEEEYDDDDDDDEEEEEEEGEDGDVRNDKWWKDMPEDVDALQLERHKMKETEQREARSSMRRGMLRDVACGCDNQRGLIWQAPISFLV